jgi:hypothetical protein
VLGGAGRTEVLFAAPRPARVWSSRLSAAFRGCGLECVGESNTDRFSEAVSLPFRAVVTGHPAGSPEGWPLSLSDELIPALAGGRWAWMVFALPHAPSEVQGYVRELRNEIQETVSAHLRPGSAEQTNNPAAQRYLELLNASSVRAEAGLVEGLWEVRTMLAADSRELLAMGSHSIQAHLGRGGEPEPIRIRSVPAGSPQSADNPVRCSTVLATSELAILLSPPGRETAGYAMRSSVDFDEDPPFAGSVERCLSLGVILSHSNATGNWLDVPSKSLTGHLLVAGASGSGKTRTMQFLLRQLWEEYGVPWLVLEPSLKSEYRSLLDSPTGKELRILTPGNEDIAPLRLSPLEVPNGIAVQTHVDALLGLFKAAFSWVTPMPYVLEQALHRVYERAGWDMSAGPATRGSTPRLGNLASAVEEITAECGWDAEISANIRAGILTRLRGLTLGAKGKIFDTSAVTNFEDLLSRPTVVELSAIGSDEEKAFLVGLIAQRILYHRQAEARLCGQLRHVLVIEEAHRLLRAAPSGRALESADPAGHAVEAFANALAEVRAFGQGIAVVEQIPSKLLPDVVKNTNVKIIHRLAGEDDRLLVGGAAGLTDERLRVLATLPTGEAVVAVAESGTACRVRVPDHSRSGHAAEVPSDREVAKLMARWLPLESEPDIRGGNDLHGNPSSTFAPVAGCPGCSDDRCRWQEMIATVLSRKGLLGRFDAAVGEGWHSVFAFATGEIGSQVSERQRNSAALALLMHLSSLLGWSRTTQEKLRRNILIVMESRPPNE